MITDITSTRIRIHNIYKAYEISSFFIEKDF